MLRSPAEPGGTVQRDEGPGLLRFGHRLGPVADGPGQVGSASEVEDVGEVSRGGEQGPAALVDDRDPGRGGAAEGVLDVLATLVGAAGGVEGRAGRVLGVPGHEPVALPAGEPVRAGHHGQRAGDHGRVAVDPGRVDDAAVARPVELRRRHRAALGPVLLLPAHGVDGAATAAARGVLDGPQGLPERCRAGEVDAAQPHPRVRQVHVGVDEGGEHQGAAEVHDRVHGIRVGRRGRLVAEPGHPPVGADDEGGGGGVVGGADPSPAVERRRHGATLGAARVTAARSPPARRARSARSRPPRRWARPTPRRGSRRRRCVARRRRRRSRRRRGRSPSTPEAVARPPPAAGRCARRSHR